MRWFLITVVLSLFVTGFAMAATFTIDDLGDAGDASSADNVCLTAGGVCTLRAAIQQANAGSDRDSIVFGVAGTIAPATAYPPLSAPIEIDGRTAPGYTDAPVVVIAGGGSVAIGLNFQDGSDSSSIAGLEISGFSAGIHIDSNDVTVTECFIGPLSGGLPNGVGIHVEPFTFRTVIGGGNVISGNSGDGILINGLDTTVSGNRIGTDPTGMTALGNGDAGIDLVGDINTVIGALVPAEGNLISGNNRGIVVGSFNASIFGNLIGTDATGAAALGNIRYGIHVNTSINVRIGRMDAPNVISGNLFGVRSDEETFPTILEGNIIGLDASGTTAIPNREDGVFIFAGGMVIGTAAGGNLISGNSGVGIRVLGGSSDPESGPGPTTIANNTIGLNGSGDAVPNGSHGIDVSGFSDVVIGGTSPGEGNTISGNRGAGINVPEGSNIQIYGNAIGLTPDRTTIRGNGGSGILMEAGGATIGSVGSGMNVISGNEESGIYLFFNSGGVITGNRIGTDGAGMAALGNAHAGVRIGEFSGGVISQNLISGNDLFGVLISDAGILTSGPGSTISNNVIGRNADGTAALPNGVAGVFLSQFAARNTIGPGNVISGNGGAGAGIGVAVAGEFDNLTVDNFIFGNSIFGNQGLGIDLGGTDDSPGDGVTANDPDDVDVGPNWRQNYPVITAATSSGAASSIQGTLNSTPDRTYALHFYASTAADPSGFGEGETYLGTMDVATDAGGDTAFVFNGPAIAPGSVVTGTATATGTFAGSTSEFSAAVLVTALGAASTVQFSGDPYTTAESAGSVTITVTRTGDLSAPATVAYVTADATATAGSDYTATSGTLTFAPTVGSQTFSVPILNDGADEPAELINLTLSNPAGTTLGTPSSTTITITDDDDAPAAAAAIPTTSEWGLFLLAVTLALLGLAGMTGWRS